MVHVEGQWNRGQLSKGNSCPPLLLPSLPSGCFEKGDGVKNLQKRHLEQGRLFEGSGLFVLQFPLAESRSTKTGAVGHLKISPADAKEKQLFLVEKGKKKKKKVLQGHRVGLNES